MKNELTGLPQGNLRTYYPLVLIISYITVVSFITSTGSAQLLWHLWMNHFMAGFFLVFSAFKLLNLPGFATAYAKYDVLAARWYYYGYIYPFLELSLGIAYLVQPANTTVLVITIFLMGFSSMGVAQALMKKQVISCACLGTALKLPMSAITLVEDILMVLMAITMLIIK